jgi:integrase/recombinase XerD
MARRARQYLWLYRRHLPTCKVPKKKISAEAKRTADCGCPIWIRGRTPAGIYPRQSTGLTDWNDAERLLASKMRGDQNDTANGITLADAIAKYMASRESELSEKTFAQTKLAVNRLQRFCADRGAFCIRDLTIDLLEDFKTDGLPAEMAGTTKSKVVEKIRCFLKEAYRREWLIKPMAEMIKPFRARYEQKDPYTDDEITKILSEALKLYGGTHGYAKHPGTFRLLLELMLETGMRVSDAIRFDPATVTKGEQLWIYTYVPQKSKRAERIKTIEAFISGALKNAIDECEWLSPKLPFYFGEASDPAYLANEVYARMKTIGARCCVEDCRPHRLRDTFAVRMLLAGLGIEEVSRLLGHSSVKVTEMYYAKWIAARKRRLESLVAQARMNACSNGLGNGKSDITTPASAG